VAEYSEGVAAKRDVKDHIEYLMGFDEIEDEDVHINSQGVDIIFAPVYQELLQGTVMDFVEMSPGDFRFIFLNPNDPHYYAPQQS
jgi:iron-sulfur cluster assembly protein